MIQLIAIALGGALGSVLRYVTSLGIQNWLGGSFPWGILAVNVLGSFAMGLLTMVLLHRLDLNPVWSGAILVGLLGGFTTFSSFSIDAVNLFRGGAGLQSMLYIFASIILCLLAAWLGVILGRG
ncbi:MAG: fluoride efflux transporter CrcB [Gammaproteobacteria bacterium]|nr:fluoride efflux transporter CrcB [Gammaproteobacteria bacterium]